MLGESQKKLVFFHGMLLREVLVGSRRCPREVRCRRGEKACTGPHLPAPVPVPVPPDTCLIPTFLSLSRTHDNRHGLAVPKALCCEIIAQSQVSASAAKPAMEVVPSYAARTRSHAGSQHLQKPRLRTHVRQEKSLDPPVQRACWTQRASRQAMAAIPRIQSDRHVLLWLGGWARSPRPQALSS